MSKNIYVCTKYDVQYKNLSDNYKLLEALDKSLFLVSTSQYGETQDFEIRFDNLKELIDNETNPEVRELLINLYNQADKNNDFIHFSIF